MIRANSSRQRSHHNSKCCGASSPHDSSGAAPRKTPCCSSCAGKQRDAAPQRHVVPEETAVPDIVLDVLDSASIALPGELRRWCESMFQTDLGDVRIHIGDHAAESADAINALAYSFGNHIVFGYDQFAPSTRSGLRILGHELTHLIQNRISRDVGAPSLSPFDDPQEDQAERTGLALMRGIRPAVRHDRTLEALTSRPQIQRLGANPNCTRAQRESIHQAIFNTNGWISKALTKLAARPLSRQVLSALRRNFGSTYGVAANAEMIRSRIERTQRNMLRMPFECNHTDAFCTSGHCGFAVPGSNRMTICTNVCMAAGTAWQFVAGCVLHETFHATFSRFTVDEYSGWHGHSSNDATYPGAGTDPLLNADSYTTLCMDLS
jgi:Domain of unknown function (DUF4157)